MIGLHKGRYLKAASSESDNTPQVFAPDSADDIEEAKRHTCLMLLNHEFKTEID